MRRHLLAELLGLVDLPDEARVEVDESGAREEVEAHGPHDAPHHHAVPRHLVHAVQHAPVRARHGLDEALHEDGHRAQRAQQEEQDDVGARAAQRDEVARAQRVADGHVSLGGHDDDEPGGGDDEDGDEAPGDEVEVDEQIAGAVGLLEGQRGDEQHQQAEEEVGDGQGDEADVGGDLHLGQRLVQLLLGQHEQRQEVAQQPQGADDGDAALHDVVLHLLRQAPAVLVHLPLPRPSRRPLHRAAAGVAVQRDVEAQRHRRRRRHPCLVVRRASVETHSRQGGLESTGEEGGVGGGEVRGHE